MELFCFLFVIVAIGIGLFVWNSKRTDLAWENAAASLQLKFQKDGFNHRKIFGQRAGFDVEISNYSSQVDGKTVIFTEYHLDLREPLGLELEIKRQSFNIDTRASGTRQDIILGDPVFDPKVVISGSDENAIRDFLNPDRRKILYRLFKDFDEYELNEKTVYVAKRGVQVNAGFLVKNVNLLIQTVNELGVYVHQEQESEVMPPPLPSRDRIDLDEEIELAPAILKDALFEEAEIADAAVKEAGLKAPDEPKEPEKVSELELKTAEISAPVLETKPVEDTEDVDVPDTELEFIDEVPVAELKSAEPFDREAFALICKEIFNSGLGRFEAGRLFDSQLKGETRSGVGKLKRVDKYYSDRVFGRGPGVTLQIEIGSREAGETAVAVVQLPLEESDLVMLKSKIGEPFDFSGKLLKCDLFANKIFVGNG